MSMNKFMHPRNPYRNPPDFKKLAVDYPEFRKYANQDLSGKVKLNFKDDGAVWSLTKSLLHKDFGLDVDIVEGRLVPTLPLRMNYLLWLEDLLKLYKNKEESVFGIDIGSGACCIYPLLASKYFKWHMIATEVDQDNFDCATNNVKRNNLEEFITVQKVVEETYLCGVIDEKCQFDFCMCNPPFFGDNREPKRRNEGRSEPRNAPTGADVELVTEGGEISFVKAIIDNSKQLKCSIRIYTVMLGCKSSLKPLKEYLKKQDVASIGTSMFCQGRTTRWGLAWTYDQSINLTAESINNNKNKKSETLYKHLVENINFDMAVNKFMEFLKEHQVTVEENLKSVGINILKLKARSNTWTKSRRRRREDKRKYANDVSHEDGSSTNDSKCTIDISHVEVSSSTNDSKRANDVSHEEVTSTNDRKCTTDITHEDKSSTNDSKCTNDVTHEEVLSTNDITQCSEAPENLKMNTLKRNTNGNDEHITKKLKTDSNDSKEYLLIASLTVKKIENNVEIEIKYLDGHGNKDNAHQLLQCLRNLLK